MKRILALLMMLLMAIVGHAQITHSQQGTVDAKATEILKRATAQFNQNVSFNVTMTALDSDKHQQSKQQATVNYNRGKYRVVVADQEVISDGAVVWHWNKKAKEVTISNVSNDDADLLNPGRLLANYDKNFRAKYIRTEADGSAVIDLQPKGARSYHKIRLLINEKSGRIVRMEVHKYDSSREVYEVSNFKKISNNDNTMFTFNSEKHPGVEVIDMR